MKKLVVILLIPVLILSILSGCISERKETQTTYIQSKNQPPEVVVSTSGTINPMPKYIDTTNIDAVAYAGNEITFDASDSFDPDGTIVTYEWILEYPDKTDEGAVVTCTYNIYDIFSVDLPFIVPIVLTIKDNNGSIIPYTYTVGIIPKKYVFYFDSTELKTEKPSANDNKIKAAMGKFRSIEELDYVLENPITIQKCTWNATIYLKKPLLAFVKQVSLTLYNSSGEKIAEQKSSLKMFDFSKEKTVTFSGEINNYEEFKSIKLSVSGFSFKEKISILYGGKTASFICFDFTAS